MTITSNILRRDYTANGVNTTYAFDFPIFYESNATPKFSLEVIVADTTGAESIKIETTDYTITYNTTDYVNGVINQGNVVFGTAPLNNYKVSLLRKVNFTQNNDITTSGSDALPGTALEGSLDKLTLMLLEQKESLNRVIKLPKSSLLSNIEFPIGASQADQVITVNNAGDNLTTKDLADVGLAPVSTFAKTLLDDTTASEARTTLDAQQLNANLTALAGLPGYKATTTTQGVIEIATDAETKAGTDTERAIVPSALASLFGSSVRSGSGYVRLPVKVGGAFVEIIIQWAVGTFSATGTTNSFPLAFPSSVLAVVLGNTDTIATIFGTGSITNSGFTGSKNGAGSAQTFYVAIGF